MKTLFVGLVTKVHQHDNSLDMTLNYDQSKLTAVPMLCSSMTTSSGSVDMHHPEGNPGDKIRDIYAIVMRSDIGFIALGFISPQVNQMCFDRKNFKVDRHASDVYHTISETGDIEIAHPSGTYIRIGEDYEHEDLTGKDFDGLWEIKRNLGTSPGLQVQIAGIGAWMATLTIKNDGNVELTHKKNLTINTEKTVTVNAKDIALNSQSMTHNGVNVGATHTHGGVIPGGGHSGGPG